MEFAGNTLRFLTTGQQHLAPAKNVFLAVQRGMESHLSATNADLPPHVREALSTLAGVIDQIQRTPSASSGAIDNSIDPMEDGMDTIELLRKGRACLRTLVIDQHKNLLPTLQEVEALRYMSDILHKSLTARINKYSDISPDFADLIEKSRKSFRMDTHLLMRETGLQQDILCLLGSSVECFSQMRLDAHEKSFGGILGKHTNGRFFQITSKAGINAIKPERYRANLQEELDDNFEDYFHTHISQDNNIEVTLKPQATGSWSTPDLLCKLEMIEIQASSKISNIVKEAVKQSPDLQWAGTEDIKYLELTQKAIDQLLIRNSVRPPFQKAPKDCMREGMVLAIKEIKLADFKASILTSLQKAEEKQADHLCLPIVHRASTSAEPIHDQLFKEIATSLTAQQVHEHIKNAIQTTGSHNNINWLWRYGGSNTQKLLHGLLEDVNRFEATLGDQPHPEEDAQLDQERMR